MTIPAKQFVLRRPCFHAAIATLLLACCGAACSAQVTIGVQEEIAVPGDNDNTLVSVVRVLFRKTVQGWQIVCTPSADHGSTESCDVNGAEQAKDWYVTRNGRQLATIQTQGWLAIQSGPTIGLLNISSGLAPIVGEKNARYGGWRNVPVHRPLLVSSTTLNAAGGQWKEVASNSKTLKSAWPLFRQHVPMVTQCATDRPDKQATEQQRAATIGDIEIDQDWQSAQKSHLLHIRIKPDLYQTCDAVVAMHSQMWLHQLHSGRLVPLAQAADTLLDPVEFGTFGNDRRETALFQLHGHNQDGYVLYYNRFQNQINLTWTYQ